MRIHFFTAPFYFAFIWFRVQGSGFRVQGSGFRVQGSGGGEAASIQQSSLHFGRDDVQERRIASHSLSHRFVDPSCAFGAPLL